MLTLSRKVDQQIEIGDSITVRVVRIGPNTVRLAIDAPRSMNIVRSELREKGDPRAVSPANAQD